MDAAPQSPNGPARLRNPSYGHLPTPTTTHMHSLNTRPDPSFSLLLSLPRELRERVYSFALVSDSPFWWPSKSPDADHHNVNASLVRTNKQVYSEAIDILYSQNKFLFTHPSDCNVFRVVASSASVNITSVYFRIRQKDLKLWTAYLGSKQAERSLRSDLPKLKSLWVFLRCVAMGLPAAFGSLQAAPVGALGGPGGHAQALPIALGQQMHALQQQVQSLTQVMANANAQVAVGGSQAQTGGNQLPPPPPPAPAMPFLQFAQGPMGMGGPHHGHHHHQNHPPHVNLLAQQQLQMHQQANIHPPPPLFHAPHHIGSMVNPQANRTDPRDSHTLFSTFLRFERELGIESLCLNLRDALYSGPSTLMNFDSSSSSDASSVAGSPPVAPSNEPRPEVKIVCIVHIPRRIMERVVALHPDELVVDPKTQDARTRFRKLHGIEVSLELNGCPPLRPGLDAADHGDMHAHEH